VPNRDPQPVVAEAPPEEPPPPAPADETPPAPPEPAAAAPPPVVAPPPAPVATLPPRPAPAVEAVPPRPTVREGDLVLAGTPGLAPPGFVSITKPEYPPLAKRLGVEGTVVVGVLVNETGRVEETRLVKGVQQNAGLNEAALRAARTARYRPATVNGVRVKVWVNLTIPFKL
jgi:protein TonB